MYFSVAFYISCLDCTVLNIAYSNCTLTTLTLEHSNPKSQSLVCGHYNMVQHCATVLRQRRVWQRCHVQRFCGNSLAEALLDFKSFNQFLEVVAPFPSLQPRENIISTQNGWRLRFSTKVHCLWDFNGFPSWKFG